eukprot:10316245-Alexandrium_andersonii.AAC.1
MAFTGSHRAEGRHPPRHRTTIRLDIGPQRPRPVHLAPCLARDMNLGTIEGLPWHVGGTLDFGI